MHCWELLHSCGRLTLAVQRPQSTVDKYATWKAETSAVYDCLGSGVLCEKLGYHAVPDRVSNKYVARRPPSPSKEHVKAAASPALGVPYAIEVDGTECLVAVHPNTFPYNVADDVEHNVLWSERRLPADVVEEQLGGLLGATPFLWYENAEALKSLPMVFHVHVFSKVVRGGQTAKDAS